MVASSPGSEEVLQVFNCKRRDDIRWWPFLVSSLSLNRAFNLVFILCDSAKARFVLIEDFCMAFFIENKKFGAE